MKWIDNYLSATYEDGARGPHKYDCFGVVREVLHERFGWPLMPEFGSLRHSDPKSMTIAQRETVSTMRVCEPSGGVLACVFRGALMIHVACVIELDSGLFVLEINPKQGARLSRASDFERTHLRVVYYDAR